MELFINLTYFSPWIEDVEDCVAAEEERPCDGEESDAVAGDEDEEDDGDGEAARRQVEHVLRVVASLDAKYIIKEV